MRVTNVWEGFAASILRMKWDTEMNMDMGQGAGRDNRWRVEVGALIRAIRSFHREDHWTPYPQPSQWIPFFDSADEVDILGCIQKFPDWPPGARTANGTALCH
jgi:hypothetical protein